MGIRYVGNEFGTDSSISCEQREFGAVVDVPKKMNDDAYSIK